MAKQIGIENDQERNELLKNCEERISELRAMLINKEAEINFLDFDLGRDSIPKKQNMQILNTMSAQNHAIKKLLQ